MFVFHGSQYLNFLVTPSSFGSQRGEALNKTFREFVSRHANSVRMYISPLSGGRVLYWPILVRFLLKCLFSDLFSLVHSKNETISIQMANVLTDLLLLDHRRNANVVESLLERWSKPIPPLPNGRKDPNDPNPCRINPVIIGQHLGLSIVC